MGRRQLAGRDMKIAQGHRRDAFFAKMRRKGGVPRMPTMAPEAVIVEPPEAEAAGEKMAEEAPASE